jgi:hypothetical protein
MVSRYRRRFRTDMLQGAVPMIQFFTYVILIFD